EAMAPETDRHCRKPVPDSIDIDCAGDHATTPGFGGGRQSFPLWPPDPLDGLDGTPPVPAPTPSHRRVTDVSPHFLRPTKSSLLLPQPATFTHPKILFL